MTSWPWVGLVARWTLARLAWGNSAPRRIIGGTASIYARGRRAGKEGEKRKGGGRTNNNRQADPQADEVARNATPRQRGGDRHRVGADREPCRCPERQND